MSSQDGEKNAARLTLESYLKDARSHLGPPPTRVELLAYHHDELDADAAGRVQEHIALDPEVADRFAELAAFPSSARPGDADYLSGEELEAHWGRFQEKTPSTPLDEEDSQDNDANRFLLRLRRTREIAALAALLCLAMGLGWWDRNREVTGLRTVVADLERTALAEPITRFYRSNISGFDPFRSESAPVPSQLPADVDFYVLTLAFEPSTDHGEPVGTKGLRLEIWPADVGRSGGVAPLWFEEGLRPSPFGAVDVLIPGTFLEPGKYELDLLHLDTEATTLVARYLIAM